MITVLRRCFMLSDNSEEFSEKWRNGLMPEIHRQQGCVRIEIYESGIREHRATAVIRKDEASRLKGLKALSQYQQSFAHILPFFSTQSCIKLARRLSISAGASVAASAMHLLRMELSVSAPATGSLTGRSLVAATAALLAPSTTTASAVRITAGAAFFIGISSRIRGAVF